MKDTLRIKGRKKTKKYFEKQFLRESKETEYNVEVVKWKQYLSTSRNLRIEFLNSINLHNIKIN